MRNNFKEHNVNKGSEIWVSQLDSRLLFLIEGSHSPYAV
jgi:hypothetical protein